MNRQHGEGSYGTDGPYHTWKILHKGKPIVRKAKTKDALSKKVKIVLRDLQDRKKADTGKDTVQKSMTHWLENKIRPNRELATYQSYESMCRNHIFPVIGKVRRSDLNGEHLQEVIASVQAKEDCGNTTARYALSIIGRWYGRRIVFLLEDVEVPPAARPRSRVYSAEELKGVFTGLDKTRVNISDGKKGTKHRKAAKGESYHIHRERHLFKLLTNSGLAISECLGLLIVDFNAKEQTLPVTKQLEWKPKKLKAKDEKEWGGRNWRLKPRLKTGGRIRVVHLGPEGVEAVQAQIAMVSAEKEKLGKDYFDWGLLFPTESGNPLLRRNVKRKLDSIIEDAGIAHGTIHDFRRSYGSHWAKQGKPRHVLAGQMGHASPITTDQFYIWAQEEEKREASQTFSIFGTTITESVTEKEQTGS